MIAWPCRRGSSNLGRPAGLLLSTEIWESSPVSASLMSSSQSKQVMSASSSAGAASHEFLHAPRSNQNQGLHSAASQ
eukprot:3392938-Karenia_brevis.AAC.1